MRNATVTRETRETQITLALDLDGTGRAEIDTGVGFLDHIILGASNSAKGFDFTSLAEILP